MMIQD
jgi:magnesium-transporting ATPase (P-type)